MIQLKIGNQNNRTTKVMDGSTTVREALESAGIDYTHGMVLLSGVTVSGDRIDNTLASFNVGDTATLNVVAKTDNAANIVVVGDVAVLKSAYAFDTIKQVEKYEPDALTLTDENGEEIFKVATSETADVSKFGITFADNGAEPATVTIELPIENREELLFDFVGPIAMKLEQVESKIPDALQHALAVKERIGLMITRL